jgi:hypothetical protein
MAAAVVRVMVDLEGVLSPLEYAAGVAKLERIGYDVVSSPSSNLPDRAREIELIIEDDDGGLDAHAHADACAEAFGTDARLGVITYISRGTDDDALGVLRRFGLTGDVAREIVDGEDEVVTVTITPGEARRVPESRLHTALEAALNCDVRIVMPTAR